MNCRRVIKGESGCLLEQLFKKDDLISVESSPFQCLLRLWKHSLHEHMVWFLLA